MSGKDAGSAGRIVSSAVRRPVCRPQRTLSWTLVLAIALGIGAVAGFVIMIWSVIEVIMLPF